MTVKETFALAEKVHDLKTSTLQDTDKGKPIELDAFTGFILTEAKKHNIDVPYNTALYSLLHYKYSSPSNI
jgi:ketopantoate reductase